MKIEHKSDKLMTVLIILVIALTIIEAGFLAIYGVKCMIKNECTLPYLFGLERVMAYPIIGFSNSYSESYAYSSYNDTGSCTVRINDGEIINCSDIGPGYPEGIFR